MEKFPQSFTPEWGVVEKAALIPAPIALVTAAVMYFTDWLYDPLSHAIAGVPVVSVLGHQLRFIVTVLALALALADVIWVLLNWKEWQVKRLIGSIRGTNFPLEDPDSWEMVRRLPAGACDIRSLRKGEPRVCFIKPGYRLRESDASYEILPGPKAEIACTAEQKSALSPRK